jgi:hypothetical protein
LIQKNYLEMGQKIIKLSALFFLSIGLTVIQAQTLYVVQNHDTQTAYALNSVRKITVSNGNIKIQKTDTSTGIYAIIGLKYLNFKTTSTDIDWTKIPVENARLLAYPNPVNNLLNINLEEATCGNCTLTIINFEGKTMLSQPVSGGGIISLDIGHLSPGIYICRYNSITQVKTVKIMKL